MMKKIFIILAAALGCFATAPVTSPSSASSELSSLGVVERLHEKILSYPALKNWQASTLTNLYEMDKNWEPKKKTIVEKLVTVKDNARVEKVLRATEYDGDKTKDLTAKFRAEADKLNKKSETSEHKDGGRKGGRYRGLDLNRRELFPFEENKRKDYDFEVSEGFLEADRKVIILETRSRQKSSEYYEGRYYIHPETFDILRVELQPAKNPGPLRLLEMHIDFRHLPEGYLVIDTARVRIHVGLIVKNIRMESEEIYSDYEVFADSNSVTGYLSPRIPSILSRNIQCQNPTNGNGYSYFRLWAGFAKAALITWELTVKAAMITAASPLARKTQTDKEARNANPSNHRFITQ